MTGERIEAIEKGIAAHAVNAPAAILPHAGARFEGKVERQESQAPKVTRHEMEVIWRARLEQSLQQYLVATREYRGLLREEPDGRPPGKDSPLARARLAESQALLEYSRVLGIFNDLAAYGKLPEERAFEAAERAMTKDATLISVVDDDESIRDSTRKLLRSAGYAVATFASAESFLGTGAIAETECVILDVRMAGMDGLELQRRLNACGAGVPIVFVTAHDDATSRRLAIEGGAVDFLTKPFEANTLITTIQTALARRDVR